jgi:hypothetical protein
MSGDTSSSSNAAIRDSSAELAVRMGVVVSIYLIKPAVGGFSRPMPVSYPAMSTPMTNLIRVAAGAALGA